MHCSNGVQPVPKAVYHCGWRDKHDCPHLSQVHYH